MRSFIMSAHAPLSLSLSLAVSLSLYISLSLYLYLSISLSICLSLSYISLFIYSSVSRKRQTGQRTCKQAPNQEIRQANIYIYIHI
jgi:hypothetical protein